ncbi:MAG: 50S ribosomal protein L6 [Phycisphaeraceae bacterium]|nr:50S ribosomal protein L6 [Phycisphaeraceae bacterium]
MSRIGKQPVQVPAGVKVGVQGRKVTIGGAGGNLTLDCPEGVNVKFNEADKAIVLTIADEDKDNARVKALWGSTRAHLRNMVEGVTKGYEKTMEVVGVGWTAAVAGKKLKLTVGFANPIEMNIPDGLKVTVEKQFVKIAGPNKQQVGEFAASMRAHRKPEPYNGKGIKYTTEVIKKKQGKQFGATA